jgi:ABC-type multidrug transport system fused ATPase/permease subunit
VKIARINAAVTPIGGLAANGAFIVVLGVGGYRVASGETPVASLVTFILLMFLMIRPVGQAFGAYSSVQTALGALARINEIIALPVEDTDAERAAGRNVKVGDATDTDFWNSIKAANGKELIVLAMPSHHSNVYAAQQIRNAGLTSHVVAIAKFAEEVRELEALGVPSFNMYSEAGSGLARHALQAMGKRGL